MLYEVNKGTLAIIPTSADGSLILEDKNEYQINKLPFDIMDYSCKYFGSSYEGRKEGTKDILSIEYKVPIIIEDSNALVFFPTISPRDPKCSWISVKRIKDFYQQDEYTTVIIFDNDKKLVLPVSFRSLENQILRATRLESIIRNRKSH